MDGLADCEIKGSCLPLSQSACLPLSPTLSLFFNRFFPFSLSYFFSAPLLEMSSSCYHANVTVSLTSPLSISQQTHRFIDCPDDL